MMSPGDEATSEALTRKRTGATSTKSQRRKRSKFNYINALSQLCSSLLSTSLFRTHGVCMHNSERFYNLMARLLKSRGKKDFALKIKYSAAPARGDL